MTTFNCAAILFDLDGVLVDSTGSVTRQWRRWAEEQDLEPDKVVETAHGVRTIEIVRRLAPHLDAKAETLTTSPAFREAFERRRCLVPADWFYEWLRVDPKTKQPFAIALKDRSMFPFAGLWECWKDKATGGRLYTFTIVTTDPNEVVAHLHNRMPVILSPEDYDRWLAPVDLAQLPVDLLRPFPADMMTTWKVSKAVGNVKNDDPSLIAPI